MNDDFENASPEPEVDAEESFAELFESYSTGMNENIQVGDRIRGRIISIGGSNVFVDTGTKVDGVVEKNELLDDDGQLSVAEGDELDLYVVAADESEIRLSKAISGIGGLNMLKDAWTERIPVEGKVVAAIKGGFHVEMIKRRAFCPISQMDVAYVEDPSVYVGQTLTFLIKRFEESGRNIVVSRREILQKELDESRKAFMAELQPDALLEGSVVRIVPFGAFVSLAPGVEGLVHISELSWSRLDTPDQAVTVGDRLQVKVLGIKAGEKPGTQKIALSVKQAMGDPWADAQQRVPVGAKMLGKVTRCANFGAFVELFPGIEGLVHISEMSYTRRVMRPEEIVSPGDEIMVMVKAFDLDRKRISLSIKDAEGDPWADVQETFKPGKTVQGRVEKKEGFGIFVNLAPGITGLLPKSKIAASDNAAQIEALKPGAAITVTVDSINVAERKISLGAGGGTDDQGWQEFSGGSSDTLGSLGDQLKEALSRKKNGG
ncbi:30S ribosomal protein S1 [Desulfosarcina ovata]|uniref:30S ribosomal protein S1 n=1 Tax=Desulfosarcina ovata subsp. ovata TaxID=2752305 RepID=A0A5K8AC65_9BACT|nr:30S ribosomal protein S1 [Desulfosarcina ovata]BBO90131.1 30S ribosomal protein S1 [Desulfosarcina ovata subsp. ovata]